MAMEKGTEERIEKKMKRLLTSLPVILGLATLAALLLMFIIVDDPSDSPVTPKKAGPAHTTEAAP